MLRPARPDTTASGLNDAFPAPACLGDLKVIIDEYMHNIITQGLQSSFRRLVKRK
jgi:hypothetical protein